MKTNQIPAAHRWLLSLGIPALVCAMGWGQVLMHNQDLRYKAVRSYQDQQQKLLAVVASAIGHRLLHGQPPHAVSQDNHIGVIQSLVDDFNQIKNLQVEAFPIAQNRYAIQARWQPMSLKLTPLSHQSHGLQPSFTPVSYGGPKALLLAQSSSTPAHSAHKWQQVPSQLIKTEQTLVVFPNSPRSETWLIRSSTTLQLILQKSGSAKQIERGVANMSVFTIGMIALAGVLFRLQKKHSQYETEVLAQLMDTDPLTGLANRRKLQQQGSKALHSLNDEQSLALIILNLDRFRPINDLLGPDAGDELLIKVAIRLQNCLRQEDLLARLSGDEFAVLLRHSGDYHAQVCAERLLRELDHPFWINGRANHISGSIGIATTRNASLTFSQFLSQSDAAMCRTKSQQQGGYTLFNASMYSETMDQLSLEADLRRAIERHELRVYYQPIVDLKTRQTKSYEALVRWQHHQRGLLYPGAFLPLASAIGWTISMERWVLRQACGQMAAWYGSHQQNMPQRPSVSVNISAQHLAQACQPHYDLVGYIEKVLQETGWPAQCLTLEITEDALINSAEAVAKRLIEIQQLGVRISLDDFGTGYSSLSYLQNFPVDILKIDKSFIQTIHDRMQDGEIVKTIIALANSLGVSTIAEGIETEAQLEHLRSLDCQYGQGFLFSQPLKHLGPDRRMPAIPPTSIMTSLTP